MPEEPGVMDTLGWIYYKMGDNNQAIALLEKVISSVPNDPVFNYHFGMALYKSGRLDEAREKLKIAIDSNKSFKGREEAEKTMKIIS